MPKSFYVHYAYRIRLFEVITLWPNELSKIRSSWPGFLGSAWCACLAWMSLIIPMSLTIACGRDFDSDRRCGVSDGARERRLASRG